MINLFKYIGLVLSANMFFVTGLAQTLEIKIHNLKKSEGQLCVALFNSKEGFKHEDPCWYKIYAKDKIDEEFELSVELKAGEYGLTVLDDVNMDKKMNYTNIGFPKEGFGFGGYRHKGIFKPGFNSFKFKLEEGQNLKIEVEMKYY